MLKFPVQVQAGASSGQLDLLSFARPRQLMIEMTSRCNLRCVYCPKADPAYNQLPGRDEDMAPDWRQRALDLVRETAPQQVMLSGTGETTFMQDWMEAVRPFRALGSRLMMISNFGRNLSPEEIDFLSEFDALTVSIDTCDEATMAAVRKKVSVARITHNVVMVRAAARRSGRRGPEINVNCTVQIANIDKLKDLAAYCSTVGVDILTLSSLFEPDLPSELAQGIERLPADRLAAARQHVLETIALCRDLGLTLQIQPRLAALLDGTSEDAVHVPNRKTRLCMQPWQQYTVAADGKLFPCCVTSEHVGDLAQPGNPLDGDGIRAFRRRLLEGDMPDMCRHCSNAPLGDNVTLMSMVASFLVESGVPLQRDAA